MLYEIFTVYSLQRCAKSIYYIACCAKSIRSLACCVKSILFSYMLCVLCNLYIDGHRYFKK